MKTESIIGKRYSTLDNSWSLNLTRPLMRDSHIGYIENNPRLAGTYNSSPIGSTIITEPFKIFVESPIKGNPDLERDFIIVNIDGSNESALVMYYPSGVEGYLQSKNDYTDFKIVEPLKLK